MINTELIEKFMPVTDEEKHIIDASGKIDCSIYTNRNDCISSVFAAAGFVLANTPREAITYPSSNARRITPGFG